MKQLKSSLPELRALFERSITIRDIAEPLVSFDAEHPVLHIDCVMEEEDYDIVGSRQDGLVTGYARRVDLLGGNLEITLYHSNLLSWYLRRLPS